MPARDTPRPLPTAPITIGVSVTPVARTTTVSSTTVPIPAPRPSTALQALQAVRANNNGQLPQERRKFRGQCPLLPYLVRKCPNERFATQVHFELHYVVSTIKRIVECEFMFDETNPSIILCDRDLEMALLVRALHLTEIREKVTAQLVLLDSPEADEAFPPQPPLPQYPMLLPRQRPVGQPRGIYDREFNIAPNRPIRLTERFRVKQHFLACLRSLPEVENTREVFQYHELSKFLSQYIMAHKQTFFDNRNIKMVVCDGDPLGTAFRVRAFHRTQVMPLMRSMLIPLSPSEERALGPPPELPAHLERNNTPAAVTSSGYGTGSSVITKAANSTTTPSSTPPSVRTISTLAPAVQLAVAKILERTRTGADKYAHISERLVSVPAPSTTALSDIVEPTPLTKEYHVSKEYLCGIRAGHSPAALATDPERKRDVPEGNDQATISIAKRARLSSASDSDSSREQVNSSESKYAEQEYDTARVHTTSESESNSDVDSHGTGTVVAEIRLDYAEYTEYEVDSDEDRKEASLRKGPVEANGDSNDDTDVAPLTTQITRPLVDTSSSAPDISDADDNDDHNTTQAAATLAEHSYTKRGKTCCACKVPLVQGITYCRPCWAIRQEWIPNRPTRRRRRPAPRATTGSTAAPGDKGKRTPGLAIKSSHIDKHSTAVEACTKPSYTDFMNWAIPECRTKTKEFAVMTLTDAQDRFCHAKGIPIPPKAEKIDNICGFCMTRKKNAGIIHGRIIHQVSCYPCAKKLYKQRDPCPICRRKIEKIAEVHVS